MNLKLKKIDNSVIVVMDDDVFYRSILGTKDPEQLYTDIQRVVDKLKSGLVEDADEHARLKRELRILMNPHTHKKFKEAGEASDDINQEALDLALDGDEDVDLNEVVRLTEENENLEVDSMGCVYLKGHSVPMPRDLVNAFMDATYNDESKYTVESLENFWKWAVLNPNGEARNDLFKWFRTGEFSITDEGMVVAYRCVDIKDKGNDNDKLWEYVRDSYIKIKGWKKSPKNYQIAEDENGDYFIVNMEFHPDSLGSLDELYNDMVEDNTDSSNVTYTDSHTRTFNIKLGEEVSMDREECDSNRNASCSSGLHFMSKRYSLRLGEVKIIVLINPMNIVAFPHYDNTKGRCCAYLPVAVADEDENGNLKPFDPGSYSFEYHGLEQERLENLAFLEGFEALIDKGIIADHVNVEDFGFIRDIARTNIASKVKQAY